MILLDEEMIIQGTTFCLVDAEILEVEECSKREPDLFGIFRITSSLNWGHTYIAGICGAT